MKSHFQGGSQKQALFSQTQTTLDLLSTLQSLVKHQPASKDDSFADEQTGVLQETSINNVQQVPNKPNTPNF